MGIQPGSAKPRCDLGATGTLTLALSRRERGELESRE
jgi:hypothetical protein